MAHVHDPSRLVVLANCSTVSGTVKSVRPYDPIDGNSKLFVAVDRPYRRFLTPSNRGLLVVEVIPTDLLAVDIPAVDAHATFYGAWVLAKNELRQAEMHPAWRIDSTTSPTAPRAHRQAPRLSVQAMAPDMVPVGGGMNVVVRVNEAGGRRRPLSEVHLFFEVTSPEGIGVRWAAALTNSLGVAKVYLLALDVPGIFTLSVYAYKDGQGETVKVPFRVRRR
jgi:hypothetical protein